MEEPLDLVSVDDLVDSMPVREFRVYKGRKHYSGWYFSTTMNRLVAYESRLELARILLADFDPQVTGIAAQPLRLATHEGARMRRHVPDLLLTRRDGSVMVVDVKAPERVGSVANQRVFTWTRRLAASRGWGFEVWAGTDATFLTNVRFLANYRLPSRVECSLIPQVMAHITDGATIMGVERALPHVPVVLARPVLLHLLWTGRLVTDLRHLLDALSLVMHTGLAEGALTTQFKRLERDIGARLYERATSTAPMRVAVRGQALLKALAQPQVQELMQQASASWAGPMPAGGVRCWSPARRQASLKPGTPDLAPRITRTRIAAPRPPRITAPRPKPPRVREVPTARELRVTPVVFAVLRVLLDAHEELYGMQISNRSGLSDGTLSPLLKRLKDAGWIISRRETPEAWQQDPTGPAGVNRARRTYHVLTEHGRLAALREVSSRTNPT